ncbi:MAG: general secretion pathway protein GspK [Kiritimatiellae bacterium]|nr:general secretion pathway protein GspK [Kiritimatiellia bacterium]
MRKSGSALILVLWVIGLLSMIVVSFAFDAHLEGKLISSSRRRMKANYYALSGFELAKSFLDHSREITGDETDQEKEEDQRYEQAISLHFGRTVQLSHDFTEADGETVVGTVTVDIEPIESLRNVNKLTEEDWERIFERVMGLPETYWPDLIDSFFDWTDEDDTERENGAETEDYYETLPKPYAAANAPLDSVRELRLIKGFDEAILTGGIYDPDRTGQSNLVISNGVQRLLTVYGEGKVNINALPAGQDGYDILMTLPGVEDELTALAILEEREEGGNLNASDENDFRAFRSAEDAHERLKNIVDDEEFFNFISTGSEIFRITCIGSIESMGRVSKRISAIVYATDDIWRILRWDEEAR